jgi:hypothetical protein
MSVVGGEVLHADPLVISSWCQWLVARCSMLTHLWSPAGVIGLWRGAPCWPTCDLQLVSVVGGAVLHADPLVISSWCQWLVARCSMLTHLWSPASVGGWWRGAPFWPTCDLQLVSVVGGEVLHADPLALDVGPTHSLRYISTQGTPVIVPIFIKNICLHHFDKVYGTGTSNFINLRRETNWKKREKKYNRQVHFILELMRKGHDCRICEMYYRLVIKDLISIGSVNNFKFILVEGRLNRSDLLKVLWLIRLL